MRLAITILMIVAVAACSVLWAKKDKPPVNWQMARVLDSTAIKTRIAAKEVPDNIPTIRDTDLMLLSDEFAYVIEDTRVSGRTSLVGLTERAVSSRHHGCHFIVGDEVKYWQEKLILHVIDVDGKECKVEVLRQERLQKSPLKQ